MFRVYVDVVDVLIQCAEMSMSSSVGRACVMREHVVGERVGADVSARTCRRANVMRASVGESSKWKGN
jgi:hypothetical protein